ncbi:MAG: acyltransferase [Clostridiales bacterium]|nr:acyltransferase [Clostridiales bacterium]
MREISNPADKKRIAYIDIAKGIALLFVIFGHTFRDSMRDTYAWCALSYSIVYSFHVSTFFTLSGISYRLTLKKHLSDFPPKYIGDKAKHLLLPWFSYSVLIYLIFFAASFLPRIGDMLSDTRVSLKEYVIGMLCNNNPYSFHLWFLNTLFFAVVVTFLIDRFWGEKGAKTLKIILLILVPAVYFTLDRREFWIFISKAFSNGDVTAAGEALFKRWNALWVIKGFLQKWPCFLLGTLIDAKMPEKNAKPLTLSGAAAFAFLIAYHILSYGKDISSWVLSFVLGYSEFVVVFFVSFGIMAVSFLLEKRLSLIESLGKHSMTYYIYHQPFCCAVIGMILYDGLKLPVLIVVPVCFIASLVLPYILCRIINAVKLSKLFKIIGLPTEVLSCRK